MIELAVIIQLSLTTSSCDDLKKEDDYDGTYEDETSSRSVVIKSINHYELNIEISIGNMKGCSSKISGTATIRVEGVASFLDDNCIKLLFDYSDYHGMT